MPYIKQEDRLKYQKSLDRVVDTFFEYIQENTLNKTSGAMIEFFIELVHGSYHQALAARNKENAFKISYSVYNEMVGVFECALLEYARRNEHVPVTRLDVEISVNEERFYDSELKNLVDTIVDETYCQNLSVISGHLNYLMTAMIYALNTRTNEVGLYTKTFSVGKIISILDFAKMALYGEMVIPYEDVKIEENGDVQ